MTRAKVLTVSSLSKKYCRELRRALWYGLRDIAREVTLRGVSSERGAGESLAVVGAPASEQGNARSMVNQSAVLDVEWEPRG
jgi:hypothetical protein